jgi:hypothetical protein
VLELVYTAYDLRPFAEDMGYHGEPFRWDDPSTGSGRRAQLRAQLDAYYARLYGLTRDELRYILDPKEVHGEDFPGETFRVLKEKELKAFGEFRTRRLVLEAWDGLEGVEVRGYAGKQVDRDEPTVFRGQSAPGKGESLSTGKTEGPISDLQSSAAREEASAPSTDWGMYRCEVCGQMMMGFAREDHARKVHGGRVGEK